MKTTPSTVLRKLNEPYELTREQIDYFDRNRFIKLKQVLEEEVLTYYSGVITECVNKLNTEERPLEERSTYGKAFLQLFNLWTHDERIRDLIFSKRLGKLATDLMQTNGARLYHDQALYKEAGGGFTPWHADQYYWPLQTDKTITAWMPLQATPYEMGPLEFSAGSHVIVEGRDLEISDNSELLIQEKLRVTNFMHVVEPFDAGEISFHSGWVFHRAGANQTDTLRKVMTIIYMDQDMLLKEPENKNQLHDWNTWCPGAKVGEIIETPLNPLLFSYK